MNLEHLNPAQLEAVTSGEGPVMVLAGAGSGKTSVLTHRLAYIIENWDIDPSSILAMTFTNKAANEMKQRVENILGISVKGMWLGTFHSIALRLLRIYSDIIGISKGFVVYDNADSKSLIKRILKNNDISSLTVSEVRKYISRKKRDGHLPEDLLIKNPIEERMLPLFKQYQSQLRQLNAVDFDDMLLYTVRFLLSNEKTRQAISGKFNYILIDEYQDINNIQYNMVTLCSRKPHNIFLVGDEDQTIYSFRGSNIENIFKFENNFPDVRIIKLEQNYRSTSNILKVASEIISNNTNRKDKVLWTEIEHGEPVMLLETEDYIQESKVISENIRKLKNKYPLGKMAVLYRTNAQSRIFENSFIKYNIPYEIIGGIRFFERKEIKDIISYLRLVVNTKDIQSLLHIINTPIRGIGKTTIEKLTRIAKENNESLYETISKIKSSDVGAKQFNSLLEFHKLIEDLKEKITYLPVVEFLKYMIDKIKYIEFLESKKTDNKIKVTERIENIYEFINAVIQFHQEYPDLGIIEYLQNISLLSDIDSWQQESDKINLMTIHSSKGLEFDAVFIVGVESGILPHIRSEITNNEIEEERRLFYVAITRAKNNLFISYSNSRGYRTTGPSSFIAELPISKLILKDNEKPASRSKNDMLQGIWMRHKVWGKVQIISTDGKKAILKLSDGSTKPVLLEFAPLEAL